MFYCLFLTLSILKKNNQTSHRTSRPKLACLTVVGLVKRQHMSKHNYVKTCQIVTVEYDQNSCKIGQHEGMIFIAECSNLWFTNHWSEQDLYCMAGIQSSCFVFLFNSTALVIGTIFFFLCKEHSASLKKKEKAAKQKNWYESVWKGSVVQLCYSKWRYFKGLLAVEKSLRYASEQKKSEKKQ